MSAGSVLSWMAQNTLIVAALAPIVWAIGRCFRRRPAFVHLLWLVLLVKLVCPPVANWPWSVSALSGTVEPNVERHPPTAADAEFVAVSMPPAQPRFELDGVIDEFTAPTSGAAVPSSAVSRWEWIDVLALVWISGCLLAAAREVGRHRKFSRIRREALPAPPWLHSEVRQIAAQYRLRTPLVEVLPRLAAPVVGRIRRSQLYWPIDCLDTERIQEWRSILCHELAHLKRGDHFVAWVELLAGILHWWNPAFWIVRHQLHESAEQACDAWALSQEPSARKRYAECLLEFGRHRTMRRLLPVSALGVTSHNYRSLKRRITMIFDERVKTRVSVTGVIAVMLLAGFTLPGFSAQQEPQPSGEVQPEPRKEFTFVRVNYPSTERRQVRRDGFEGGRWATDYPDAETNLTAHLREIAGEKLPGIAIADPVFRKLDAADLNDHPLLYFGEASTLSLGDGDIEIIRKYVAAGGMLMFDDFWGPTEWDAVAAQVRKVFPDREIIDLPLDHVLFRNVYQLHAYPQVVGISYFHSGKTSEFQNEPAHFRAVLGADGRVLVLLCHNTDLADGWERSGVNQAYYEQNSLAKAYPMAVNIVSYVMSRGAQIAPAGAGRLRPAIPDAAVAYQPLPPPDATGVQVPREIIIGKNFVLFPVTTQLQRDLINHVQQEVPPIQAYLVLNGVALQRDNGTFDLQGIDQAELWAALQKYPQRDRGSISVATFHFWDGARGNKEIFSLESTGMIQKTGGFAREITRDFLGFAKDWQSVLDRIPAPAQQHFDAAETPVIGERFVGIVLENSLSRFLTGDADCFVEFKEVMEYEGVDFPLSPQTSELIRLFANELDLKRRSGMFLSIKARSGAGGSVGEGMTDVDRDGGAKAVGFDVLTTQLRVVSIQN